MSSGNNNDLIKLISLLCDIYETKNIFKLRFKNKKQKLNKTQHHKTKQKNKK